jgi:hypothetical protein
MLPQLQPRDAAIEPQLDLQELRETFKKDKQSLSGLEWLDIIVDSEEVQYSTLAPLYLPPSTLAFSMDLASEVKSNNLAQVLGMFFGGILAKFESKDKEIAMLRAQSMKQYEETSAINSQYNEVSSRMHLDPHAHMHTHNTHTHRSR